MGEAETVEVPTVRTTDGRVAITAESAVNFLWIAEFVARFPNYWVWDDYYHGWLSPLPEPIPTHSLGKGGS